jgi:hypothetical protein
MPTGLAVWRLKVLEPCDGLKLKIRFREEGKEKVMVHTLNAGGGKGQAYAPPIALHTDLGMEYTTWVEHRQAGFLNFIPYVEEFWGLWMQWISVHWLLMVLSPWLMGYLIVAVILVPISRNVLGVY